MHPRILNQLTRIAIDNPGVQGRFKIAAGIVYKRQLIATGVNSYKTHPMMMPINGYRDGQMFLHAEPDAIKNALRLITEDQLRRSSLYIVRVKHPEPLSNDWVYGLAKPCPGCQQTIASFGIADVQYTLDEEEVMVA